MKNQRNKTTYYYYMYSGAKYRFSVPNINNKSISRLKTDTVQYSYFICVEYELKEFSSNWLLGVSVNPWAITHYLRLRFQIAIMTFSSEIKKKWESKFVGTAVRWCILHWTCHSFSHIISTFYNVHVMILVGKCCDLR